ncbi:MAG: DNA polymerase III subunit delta [Acidobacteria bacterium]|nr:MAG: DNA polymerase III subunit delta [Acidobacteriota bacterium]
MAGRDPVELFLESGDGPPVLLLAGDDEEAIGAALARVVEAVPEEERAAAVERFDVADLARALDAARTPSLLGGRRVVIVDAGAALGPGGDGSVRERLEAHLERFPRREGCAALLVVVARRIDGRSRLAKRLAAEGALAVFDRPKERDMPAWVAAEARRRGLTLEPAACQAIADAVGSDTALAARELDKLALAAPAAGRRGRRSVATPLVEALLRPGRSVGAFALEDALLAGRAAEALDALDRHLAGAGPGAGPALLGRLAAIARRLTVAHAVVSGGGGEAAVRDALGCHPFVARKYAEAARRGGARGEHGLAAAVAADGMLKSGSDARGALVPVVLALAGAGRGDAGGPPGRRRARG